MKLTRKMALLTLAAVVTAGITAGCGGSKKTDLTAETTSQSAETTANETKGEETPLEIAEGGKLTVAIPLSHNTFLCPSQPPPVTGSVHSL